jgi:tetratricopeptide (TPR) repeat protein
MASKHEIAALYADDRLVRIVALMPEYLQCHPDDDHAWLIYGDCLRQLGRRSDARVALSKSLELAPIDGRWQPHSQLGNFYAECEMHDLAESHFTAALESQEAQDKDWLWYMRGMNLAHQERFDESLDCFLKAAKLDWDDEESHYQIAFVLRALNRNEEAAVAAKRALSLKPDYPNAAKLLRSLQELQ